jgi:hypothetical protein
MVRSISFIWKLRKVIPCAVAMQIVVGPALAGDVNNVCGWEGGRCTVNPAFIGAPCRCITSQGAVEGSILPPGEGYANQQQQMTITGACKTRRGTCQTYPAEMGSPCECFGDEGIVVPLYK